MAWWVHGPRTEGPFGTEMAAAVAAGELEAETKAYCWYSQHEDPDANPKHHTGDPYE